MKFCQKFTCLFYWFNGLKNTAVYLSDTITKKICLTLWCNFQLYESADEFAGYRPSDATLGHVYAFTAHLVLMKIILSTYSLLVGLIFCSCFAAAQQAAPQGDFLVSFAPGISPVEQPAGFIRFSARKISGLMNIWLLKPAPGLTWPADAESRISRMPGFQAIQMDQQVSLRQSPAGSPNWFVLPNDALFAQQWYFVNDGLGGGQFDVDLDANQAWEITTGGISPAGDTIVVAVIDGAFQHTHEDFDNNIWVNRAEIPNDLLDNDDNGFTDDYAGWNVWTENDQINLGMVGHGTAVAGMIGARGNNEKGISGVNWQIKMMLVAGGNTIANVLSAYDYVYQARKRYNDTNGQQGAFVTVVNCSFGVDYGQPAAAPLWCALFDSLGAVGILSVAATANNPVDVDQVGDLPTGCGSEFLISVTSLTKTDNKAPNAAWGATHVDLGAFGQDVLSTAANHQYAPASGTSFAAPQVAGAAALLYSAPCPNLIALAKAQPAAAALWVKNLIIESVTPTPAMNAITQSGGRLNLNNMLLDYEEQCSPCPPPFALSANNPTPTSAQLNWLESGIQNGVALRWRKLGDPDWNILLDVNAGVILDNLTPCTTYEFAAIAVCDQGLSSGWSDPYQFQSAGCCEAPANLNLEQATENLLKLSWQSVAGASGYELMYQPGGSTEWQTISVENSPVSIDGLSPCLAYRFKLRAFCNPGPTAYSPIQEFSTKGCGACLDHVYCTATAQVSAQEWIEFITVANWSNQGLSNAGPGYQNYAVADGELLQLRAGNQYPVLISPAFAGTAQKEFYRVFIDYNGDGSFASDELAFDPGFAHDGPVNGILSPPLNLTPGLSRMRVMMKAKNATNAAPGPCETFDFGQVEDYCVWLLPPMVSAALEPADPIKLHVWPVPAAEQIHIAANEALAGARHLLIRDALGRVVFEQTGELPTSVRVKGWAPGVYTIILEQDNRTIQTRMIKI